MAKKDSQKQNILLAKQDESIFINGAASDYSNWMPMSNARYGDMDAFVRKFKALDREKIIRVSINLGRKRPKFSMRELLLLNPHQRNGIMTLNLGRSRPK